MSLRPPDFWQAAQDLLPEMVALRRDLHRHPELGFQEYRTAGIIAAKLNALGLEVQQGVGETGVIGLLGGNQPGPTVLLRFDMDALPITEANQTDYISTTPGVMHACGHDGHVTIGLTVAKLLQPYQTQMRGTLKFVFQPAEEGMGGATAMVRADALQNPRPDYAFAMHLWNDYPLGWFAATPNATMAAADCWSCTITGAGGHGASPYQTHDPIVAAAQIVCALQTIVSRNINALDAAVVSVTKISGGEAFNVIPDQVQLLGTLRTFETKVRERVIARLEQLCQGIAQSFECQAQVQVTRNTLPICNDPDTAAIVRQIANSMPGFSSVTDNERTMGAEDFGEFAVDVPSCYFFVGSNNAAAGLNFPHHHPRFDFDERALPAGAAVMAAVAAHYTLS
jgi:amidohydrolase